MRFKEFEKKYCSKCPHLEDSKSLVGAVVYCKLCIEKFREEGIVISDD